MFLSTVDNNNVCDFYEYSLSSLHWLVKSNNLLFLWYFYCWLITILHICINILHWWQIDWIDIWATPTLSNPFPNQTIILSVGQAIDEMPKSEIEKRKKSMESISRISRRKKRNVEICFLVREEDENFCKKNREICNFLQFREEKEKFWKQISWFERRSRRRDFKFFVTRKRNSPTTIHIPIFV